MAFMSRWPINPSNRITYSSFIIHHSTFIVYHSWFSPMSMPIPNIQCLIIMSNQDDTFLFLLADCKSARLLPRTNALANHTNNKPVTMLFSCLFIVSTITCIKPSPSLSPSLSPHQDHHHCPISPPSKVKYQPSVNKKTKL